MLSYYKGEKFMNFNTLLLQYKLPLAIYYPDTFPVYAVVVLVRV